ncbi:MAG TPA: hypothetical protein VFL54_09345, partial [Gammaproteobacteria bacterium]|nr:hypothetical protein [Gammaproteobacteria bacterium]
MRPLFSRLWLAFRSQSQFVLERRQTTRLYRPGWRGFCMRSSSICVGIGLLAILSLPMKPAVASVIAVSAGDVTKGDSNGCSLIDAITAANQSTTTNMTVAGCVPIGTPNGGDGGTYTTGTVIKLAAGTYTLTQVNNSWYGANGLPAIATDITIVGDPDGSVIERSTAAGTPTFRFFFVGGGQPLAGYNPPAGAPANDLGGGAAGMGGAIYNQGVLLLKGATLADNQALGGEGGGGGLSGGGGLYTAAAGSAGGSGGIAGSGGAGVLTGAGGNGGIGGGGGLSLGYGVGGTGGYGGGGGGGGGSAGAGGDGGFGGGGGGSLTPDSAGAGGFGGGAGLSSLGGGGAALGGAIFNEGGTVNLLNSTLSGNSARGGTSYYDGAGYGAALFNLNGTITIRYSTLANNSVDG